MWLWLILLGLWACNGDNNTTVEPQQTTPTDNGGIPSSCVAIQSFANAGEGDVTILANCTDGNGNVVETCFSTGPGSSDAVPVPCSPAGSSAVAIPPS